MNDWIEDVRARPWMYVGSIEGLVRELVSNVLEHHGVGQVRRMDLELGDEGCVVVDVDGPGIEVAQMEDGVPLVERVFTSSWDQPTRAANNLIVQLGPGVGLGPVCAVSRAVQVDAYREDGHYRVRFARGRIVEPLQRLGIAERRGTRIEAQLDTEILRWRTWPTVSVEDRLRELPALCPGLRTSLRVHNRFGPAADLGVLAERLVDGPRLHAAPIVGSFEDASGRADVALFWVRAETPLTPVISSFCNLGRTLEGGTHVQGILPGVIEALRRFDGERRRVGARDSASSLLAVGLRAAVAVTLLDPQREGTTRDRLRTPEAGRLTERAVAGALGAALETDEDLRAELLGRIARARAGKPKRA